MQMTNVTIWARDPMVLRDWYRGVLGCVVIEETPRFVMLRGSGGAAIAFHVGEPLATPDRVQLHFEVDDVDRLHQDLVMRGIPFDEPPTERPWGVRSATLRDPAGHSVELTNPRAR